MLCVNCKKNQATKTYERIKKGKPSVEYYCMDCYARAFISDTADMTERDACPYCGTKAEEIKKRNIVGCAKCYDSMAKVLYPIVTAFQGAEAHKGKKPLGGEAERIARRYYELSTIEQKRLDEKDYDGAKLYKERMIALKSGVEEDFVWRSQSLSKQS